MADVQTATATASTAGKMGLVPATLMVAGNMMGSGVFMLPANLSAIGSIALIGWLITVVGAISLALVFAKLASIVSWTLFDGGTAKISPEKFGFPRLK